MPRWRLVAFVLADPGVLIGLRPHLSLANRVAHPHAWVTRVGADQVTAELCAAGLWLAAVWVTLGVAAGLAGALPGVAGRLGAGVARRLLPCAMYRVVAGAAGLGVLLTPALATGAPAPGPLPAAAQPIPTPRWPIDAPVRPPQWPTVTTMPPVPHSRPPAPKHTPKPRPAPHHRPTRTVVVQPGETLWTIAAEHLPGQPSPRRIAATWPRWYGANRAVIGDDPSLIVPGQHLHPPLEGSAP